MNAIAAGGGLLVDRLAGEPPVAWHPVARFGTAMAAVERRLYADRRRRGVVYAVVGVGGGALVGIALRRLLGARLATVVATAGCAAGRMLDDEARATVDLVRAGRMPEARERVRSLVGRSTEELDAGEVSRAVVESLAENGVDAVTASVFWGALAGAPGVLAHRAVNTLDAMVGHLNERHARFGWASARLDDVANYGPARLTALAVAIVRPRRARQVWRVVRRDAQRHPSPNGGVIEAAFAAALDLQLGGVNRYDGETEDRGTLGDGRPATPADVDRAIALRRDATLAVTALLIAGGMATHARPRRS